MKILIGTKNQKKEKVVGDIFTEILKPSSLDVASHNAKSLVPEAPFDKETYQGALNRAKECQAIGNANYYVGIESGLVERYGHLFEEAWAVVISDKDQIYYGYSSGLLLPAVVSKRMKAGESHMKIMKYYDDHFQLPDDNRDTWSRYTGGNISREISLQEALRNAIIQLMPSEKNLYNHTS